MNTAQIEEESNTISIGFGPLQKRKQDKTDHHFKKQSGIIEEKINQLDHRLVVSIEIITPIQLQSYSFRKELKTYRYEKKANTHDFLSDTRISEERQIQQVFGTFKDIFSEWRNKITNQFYLVFNNRDLFYFFHKPQDQDLKKQTKKGGSFLILSCRKTKYDRILDNYSIKYQKIDDSDESILLRNNEIQLFWRYIANSYMQKPTQVQLVSNFYFLNSVEVLPIELYNGKEQRPEFEYIAHKKINILEEVQNEMYSIRMQGYWLKQNLQSVYKKVQQLCEGKPFSLDFQCHYGSPDMKEFYEIL